MKLKLIVGNRRFQVDGLGDIDLVYYKCEMRSTVFFAVPEVSDKISKIVSLEDITKDHTNLDPIIAVSFPLDLSKLGGIRFQVPIEYFHRFKNLSCTHGIWKKVDCVDNLFISNSRNVLVLRNALIIGAEQVSEETVRLTFKIEHYETFPIEILDEVIEGAYKKEA